MELQTIEPRPTCPACARPPKFCWCEHLVSLETRTRVLLLQHPTERYRSIGTARMASLCLPGSELHVGVKFEGTSWFANALSDPSRPAALLYPGANAIDVDASPPGQPITLVVVDGTWHFAKKLLHANPSLAALPRYSFTPRAPSEYRIRKQPKPSCVSTIEALVHVLGVLERDPDGFRAMLGPFRAMIDAQIAYERATNTPRRRERAVPKPRKPRARSILRERAADIVCVAAEANAWPGHTWPDELVHWIAHRPSGETFEAVVAPRHPLGPGTARQTWIDADRLSRGEALSDALARWRAFLRDDDVVCSWGVHGIGLLQSAGASLPESQIDVRRVARDESHGSAGVPLAFLERMAGAREAPPPLGLGRAGARLAELVAVVRFLVSSDHQELRAPGIAPG